MTQYCDRDAVLSTLKILVPIWDESDPTGGITPKDLDDAIIEATDRMRAELSTVFDLADIQIDPLPPLIVHSTCLMAAEFILDRNGLLNQDLNEKVNKMLTDDFEGMRNLLEAGLLLDANENQIRPFVLRTTIQPSNSLAMTEVFNDPDVRFC